MKATSSFKYFTNLKANVVMQQKQFQQWDIVTIDNNMFIEQKKPNKRAKRTKKHHQYSLMAASMVSYRLQQPSPKCNPWVVGWFCFNQKTL